MQDDGDKVANLDSAFVEAAIALIEELNAEPVPKSIIDLANQLQAVIDQMQGVTPVVK